MNEYYAIVSDDNAEYDHKMMNKQKQDCRLIQIVELRKVY